MPSSVAEVTELLRNSGHHPSTPNDKGEVAPAARERPGYSYLRIMFVNTLKRVRSEHRECA